MICELSAEEFATIHESRCHYCDHQFLPLSHCTPDIVDFSNLYNIDSTVPSCPYCKNLKNSSGLTKEETELLVKTLLKKRDNDGKRSFGNSSVNHTRRRKKHSLYGKSK